MPTGCCEHRDWWPISEAADFVDMMAQAKAREAPLVLQWSVHLSWRRKWMRMLSLSCARAFATCNVDAWTVLYKIWTCVGRPDLA